MNKVQKWVREVDRLSLFASSQPQAAYAALTHGLYSKWTFLLRTIPDIQDLLQPLEEAIQHNLLPALTGKTGINDLERNLLELPVRLGGLGIVNPAKTAAAHHDSSLHITAPLAVLILQQETAYPHNNNEKQATIKRRLKSERRQKQAEDATRIRAELTPNLQRAMDLGSEKGASSWLM